MSNQVQDYSETHKIDVRSLRKHLERNKIPPPFYSDYKIPLCETSNKELLSYVQSENLSYCEKRKNNWLVKKLKNESNGGKIIEIGSGSGRNLFAWYRKGLHNLIGVDLHPNAVAFSRQTANYLNMQIKFIEKNILNLSRDDILDDVQAIVADSLLEHIPDYKSAIKTFAKILSPNGICAIIVPSALGGYSLLYDFDYKKFKWKSQSREFHPGEHVNHFWFRDLVNDFLNEGFILDDYFKFQAFRAFIHRFESKIPFNTKIIPSMEKIDYFSSKILPADSSTRIIIFRKK